MNRHKWFMPNFRLGARERSPVPASKGDPGEPAVGPTSNPGLCAKNLTEAASPSVIGISARRLTAWSSIQLVARLFCAGLGALVAAILARSLGPKSYGVYALIMSFATMGQNMADAGTTQVGVREISARLDRRGSIVASLIVVQSIGGTITMVVFGAIGLVLTNGSEAHLATALFLATLPLGGLSQRQTIVGSRLRPELTTFLLVVQSVVWLGAVAAVASIHGSLVLYAAAFDAASLIQIAVMWLVTRSLVTVTWREWRQEARALLVQGLPIGVTGLFVLAYYKLDGVLLFWLKGAAANGTYSAAYRFVDVLQLVPTTLGALLLPLASRLVVEEGRRAALRTVVQMALKLMVAAAVVITFGGIVFARPIVVLVYGAHFARSADLLSVLLLAFPLICLGYVFVGLAIVSRMTRQYLIVAAAGAVVNVSANMLLIPRYGGAAAAWTTVATELIVNSAMGIVVLRRMGIRPPFGPWARILGAGGAASLIAWRLLPYGTIPALCALVAGCGVFGWASRAVTLADLRILLDPRGVLS